MQNYELLLILPGTLSEDEVEPLLEKVSKIIVDAGGANFLVEKLEKRRLAYPIKHIRYGYFNLAYFDAEPEVVVSIQKKLVLIPELLRALVQKHDPAKQKSRVIQFGLPMGGQNREESTYSNFRASANESRPVEVKIEKEEPAKEVDSTSVKIIVDEEPSEFESSKIETESVEEEVKKEKKKEERGEVKKDIKRETKKEKVSMEDIDKKLDEILDIDLSSV